MKSDEWELGDGQNKISVKLRAKCLWFYVGKFDMSKLFSSMSLLVWGEFYF